MSERDTRLKVTFTEPERLALGRAATHQKRKAAGQVAAIVTEWLVARGYLPAPPTTP